MAETLNQCERDVEIARSKLAQDLATLRSPATFSSFTSTVKHEVLDAKDAVVAQAKDAVQSRVVDFVEDLKAKAAANPAAALTIGAGIAWQFIRNPPIATALIGAGLYSLWRTNAVHANGHDNDYYLQRGKERLKEQVAELGSSAMDVASDVGKSVSAKTDEVLDVAKDKIQGWSRETVDSANAAGSAIKAQAESIASTARRAVHDVRDQAGNATMRATAATNQLVHDTLSSGQDMMAKVGTRDNVLLGVAGLAVAAALGMAYQKRIAEEVD
jgi:ElaB/YqjD/DUF883 family membrane-anchored ribosome-binding protein